MAVGKPSQVALFWRTYRVSILFPVFSLSAIIADYSHTQKYKKSQALTVNKSEELKD